MNKLRIWMQEQGYTNSSLAQKLGFSYEYVWKVATGERQATGEFKWRFGKEFGWKQAEHVLEGDPEPESVEA